MVRPVGVAFVAGHRGLRCARRSDGRARRGSDARARVDRVSADCGQRRGMGAARPRGSFARREAALMCLIALAHGASDRYPLVIAANRDEDHERATREAHFWDESPDVLGGRDALHGGSWLALSRNGRFAAVTNLRRSPARSRSRGLLVRSFVQSAITPERFAGTVFSEAAEY